jgi:4a-hydroxytetrahydrobiopterin dehydratase
VPYATLLTDDEISAALVGLPAWRREGDAIVRELRFPTFRDAIAFVDRVADLAEAADHHPDIDIRWRRVVLSLTTKASHGLTARDVGLATQIDAEVDGEIGAHMDPEMGASPAGER